MVPSHFHNSSHSSAFPNSPAKPSLGPTSLADPRSILKPELIPVLPPALELASAPAAIYIKDELQRFLRICISTRESLNNEYCKNLYKAWYPDLHKGKLHIDSYHFIQQYENYFKMMQFTGINLTSFAAIFFSNNINICRAWHKKHHQVPSDIPISWSGFKVFLIKDLRKSGSFVDSIWSKFWRNS